MSTETNSRAIDPLLVLRVQLGDREATGELLRQIAPRLAVCLRSIIGSREDAEDLLQDVLITVYRKIHWVNEPSHLLAWAYRIAVRAAIKEIRKRKRVNHAQLTQAEWSLVQSRQTGAVAEQIVLEEQLIRGVERLPPAGRAVLCLHYLEGLTIDEAAERLGIATGTAKSRLSFGLQKLRHQLGLTRHT